VGRDDDLRLNLPDISAPGVTPSEYLDDDSVVVQIKRSELVRTLARSKASSSDTLIFQGNKLLVRGVNLPVDILGNTKQPIYQEISLRVIQWILRFFEVVKTISIVIPGKPGLAMGVVFGLTELFLIGIKR
jgi:hypothetical protein